MFKPVYRGQAKARWELHSGAVHRLKKMYGDQILEDEPELRKRISDYREDLILRMEVIDGTRTDKLQRLSVLQHLGAATELLDFTESPLVALWFACSQKPRQDGKVFILDIGDHQVATNGRLLDENGLFTTERIVYYEPDRSLGARIIAQQSVFVICNPPQIPNWCLRPVVVPKEAKEPMMEYLRRAGFSEQVLFGDVNGLARANARHVPLRAKAVPASAYREQGNQAFRAERFGDALEHYTRYAAALPKIAQPHCLVGDTLSVLGRFEEAIEAYTRAIKSISRPMDLGPGVVVDERAVSPFMLHTLYFNRGNAYAATGDHPKALDDFDAALRHGSQLKRNVLFNRGNSHFALARFADASDDFGAVWSERRGSDAALALGNCRVMMGEFAEALRSYCDGVDIGEPSGSAMSCGQNAEQVQRVLQALGERDYEVRRDGCTVYVKAQCGAATMPFTGNGGNVGNTPSGMVNARGGEGYGGSPGFRVILAADQT